MEVFMNQNICQWCNISFQTNNKRKYCSRQCFYKSQKRGKMQSCQICNILVYRKRCHFSEVFCSIECQNKGRHKKGKMLPCGLCNKLVYRSLDRLQRYKYTFCSSKCAREGMTYPTGKKNHCWKGGPSILGKVNKAKRRERLKGGGPLDPQDVIDTIECCNG